MKSTTKLLKIINSKQVFSSQRALNAEFVQSETAASFQLINNLYGYRNHLVETHKRNAKKQISRAATRNLVSQSQKATKESYTLFDKALGLVQHFEHTEVLDQIFGTWKESIAESGPIKIGELWNELQETNDLKALFHDAGLNPRILEDLTEVIISNDAEISLDQEAIKINLSNDKNLS